MVPYTLETNGQLQPALDREWLLTNGLGGFASGTALGCNIRRYHGLLCAALLPPVGRFMLLNRVGEILYIDKNTDRAIELSINEFAGSFHPRGDRYLRRFQSNETTVRWEYDAEGIAVTKTLRTARGKNAVALSYDVNPNGHEIEFRVLPFVRMLDFHALRHNKATFDESGGGANWSAKADGCQLYLATEEGIFQRAPDWWYKHLYRIETERGQDDTEDLYTPGYFVFRISKPTTFTIWASADADVKFAGGPLPNPPPEYRGRESKAPAAVNQTNTMQRLTHAASDFVVARKSPDGSLGSTIIAGYPWFADWGRDTMIALPGLLLHTGRFDEARKVLSIFAQYVDGGMIPNRFDDYNNQPSYNTVDASLWFIHACFEYARLSGDKHTLETTLRPACLKIVEGYTNGTRYHIKVDPADGLVSQGDPSTQLTWMDAKRDGVVFTPRQGKPVEINALWYNALCLLNDARAKKIADNFQNAFWINPFRGLADVVDGSRRDESIRPNQIFAVSLPHSPLTLEQQKAVVEVVRRELLTPVGLRTLAKNDPKYKGHFRGSMFQRDQAYHNGTVWPWPMGGFLEAYLKVNGRSPNSIEQARAWLKPLVDSMEENCFGQIAEVFDGDWPHSPGGCFAQAWSVGEVLRLAKDLGM